MKSKTNVIRILDNKKVKYGFSSFETDVALSGVEVAQKMSFNPEMVFKTLVTKAKSNQYYIFLVPVAQELDLKKAAKSVNEKSIEMIRSNDLLTLTGYVHGGCSPIGMKKQFKTTIDNSASNFDEIIFNAGRIGTQLNISLVELKKVIDFQLADLIKESE